MTLVTIDEARAIAHRVKQLQGMTGVRVWESVVCKRRKVIRLLIYTEMIPKLEARPGG